jgi:hypothetical protein
MNAFQKAGLKSSVNLQKLWNLSLKYTWWEFFNLLRRKEPALFKLLDSVPRVTTCGKHPRLSMNHLFDFCHPKFVPACSECGKPTLFKKAKNVRGYAKYCSVSCSSSSDAKKEKTETTMLARYGAKAYLGSVEGQNKFRATNLRNNGVEYPSQSKAVQRKIRKSNIQKFGVPYWGMSNEAFRRKRVVDKFGRVHKLQGYEPKAVDWMTSQPAVTEIISDFKIIPQIPYLTANGKSRTYYPDLLVRTTKGDQLVEVKSVWTFVGRDKGQSSINKSIAATRYMTKRGGNFWLLVFKKDGLYFKVKNPTCVKDFSKFF